MKKKIILPVIVLIVIVLVAFSQSDLAYKIGKKEDAYIDFVLEHSDDLLDAVETHVKLAEEPENSEEWKDKIAESIIDVQMELEEWKDAPEITEKVERVDSLYQKGIDEFTEAVNIHSNYSQTDEITSVGMAEGHWDRGGVFISKAMKEIRKVIEKETGIDDEDLSEDDETIEEDEDKASLIEKERKILNKSAKELSTDEIEIIGDIVSRDDFNDEDNLFIKENVFRIDEEFAEWEEEVNNND